jgi:hypothetical protein
LPFDAGNLRSGGVKQLFGLPDVEPGSRAAVTPRSGQAQAIVGDIHGLVRDPQLCVQLTQREIVRHYIRDERSLDASPAFLGGQILSARGLGHPAQSPEKVQLPVEREGGRGVARIQADAGRDEPVGSDARTALFVESRGSIDSRQLSGKRNAVLRASLQHTVRGDA